MIAVAYETGTEDDAATAVEETAAAGALDGAPDA